MFKLTRYFLLSQVIFICILGSGAFLFPDSGTGQQAMCIAAFVVSITFLHVFDDPAQQREREKD